MHAEFPGVRFIDSQGGDGVEKKPDGPWPNVLSSSASDEHCGNELPPFVVDATYIINMAVLKKHQMAGITLTAKNHYGTVNGLNHTLQRPLGSYHHFVDMMGSNQLGQKTALFIIDGLYGTDHSDSAPRRFEMAPFNGDWTSSLFMSLDSVAIDSVGLDFLKAEYSIEQPSETYLYEAAQAGDPPSGTQYIPNGADNPIGSLGVHEHWNNDADKQYSRNLGNGNGIELMYVPSDELDSIDWPHAGDEGEDTQSSFVSTDDGADSTSVGFDSETSVADTSWSTDTNVDSNTKVVDTDSSADTSSVSQFNTDEDLDADFESSSNSCGCTSVGQRGGGSLWDILGG